MFKETLKITRKSQQNTLKKKRTWSKETGENISVKRKKIGAKERHNKDNKGSKPVEEAN